MSNLSERNAYTWKRSYLWIKEQILSISSSISVLSFTAQFYFIAVMCWEFGAERKNVGVQLSKTSHEARLTAQQGPLRFANVPHSCRNSILVHIGSTSPKPALSHFNTWMQSIMAYFCENRNSSNRTGLRHFYVLNNLGYFTSWLEPAQPWNANIYDHEQLLGVFGRCGRACSVCVSQSQAARP